MAVIYREPLCLGTCILGYHIISGLVTQAANIKPPTMLAYFEGSAAASLLALIAASLTDVSIGVVTRVTVVHAVTFEELANVLILMNFN